ncbi:hypothetical protein [Amycolatopsis sp. NPDC049159]|uniref:hypothetical protein n=1 Tax=Amycolatopsis sp. NPDC049159 TaxID=3157210 RepID=UPI0033D808DA
MVLTESSVAGWLTTAFPDISSNLIAAAIGGALVWAVTRVVRRVKLFRARRFWRAMGSRQPFIVLGAPDAEALRRWEKTGMVGKGDILALVEVESQLRRLGFTGRIIEAKELPPHDLMSDLVLIGGPDGNTVTKTMLKALGDRISYGFGEARPDQATPLRDNRAGEEFSPAPDPDTGDPVEDYGLIVRSANPLAPGSAEIVILAGCWGYGTAAAAEMLDESKLLRRWPRSGKFEAVVKTSVVQGVYCKTEVQDVRAIS